MLGDSIRKLREDRNFTQQELAELLGISRQAIRMWEANKRELKATMLNKLAKALEVSVNEIISPEEETIFNKEVKMSRGVNNLKKEESMVSKNKAQKVDFELLAPNANKVALTGSFNSWDKSGLALKKDKKGLWQRELTLKPGRYEYKFIVDGQWWTDPANNNNVRNTFGSLNSVKEIK